MSAPGGRLRLFNTLTRRVTEFKPATPPNVGMYPCGPTVYADQHIGNMRSYVFADTVKRVLRWKGYRVRHVINITDVGHLTSNADEGDDKMEAAGRREGRDAWEIAQRYTELFEWDFGRLRIVEPDVWCKATDHIPEMLAFAQALARAGWCYQLPSGLYFDTSRDPGYGRLARLDLAGQRAGARVQLAAGKRHPGDFAIWRTSAPGERRQMEWDSPWGRGAPGWHLECSVMSMKYLGPHFDIHTGGVDHIPVHHTNEIAQSQAYLADGGPWVAWWLHGEFTNLRGAKISKSTGGGVLVEDLVDQGYHPLVYRYLLLHSHYRQQTEFSWDAMDAARVGMRRLLDRFATARTAPAGELAPVALGHPEAFDRAVCDDLNISAALATVSAASRDERLAEPELARLAAEFDSVLGIGLVDLRPSDMDVKRADLTVSDEQIEGLVTERNRARAKKNFARSDELRDQVVGLGAIVEDRPDGSSTWRWG